MEQVEIHLMEIWNGLKVATNVYLSSNLNKKKKWKFWSKYAWWHQQEYSEIKKKNEDAKNEWFRLEKLFIGAILFCLKLVVCGEKIVN